MKRALASIALVLVMSLGLAGCDWYGGLDFFFYGGTTVSLSDSQTNGIDYFITPSICSFNRYCVTRWLATNVHLHGDGAAQWNTALGYPNDMWNNAISPSYWDCYRDIAVHVDWFGGVNWTTSGTTILGRRFNTALFPC